MPSARRSRCPIDEDASERSIVGLPLPERLVAAARSLPAMDVVGIGDPDWWCEGACHILATATLPLVPGGVLVGIADGDVDWFDRDGGEDARRLPTLSPSCAGRLRHLFVAVPPEPGREVWTHVDGERAVDGFHMATRWSGRLVRVGDATLGAATRQGFGDAPKPVVRRLTAVLRGLLDGSVDPGEEQMSIPG